jgi:predicted RNA methylase
VLRTVFLVFKNIASALDRKPHYTDPAFDAKYGTDTSLRVGLGQLTIESKHVAAANQYQAVYSKRFGEVMALLKIDYEKFVFVDLGSGKGKALLLASDFPFRRIVGIEFARELHDAALRNVAIYRSSAQRCRDISSVCVDAIGYEFPEEPLVVFMNNPFGPRILAPVAANLRRSLERAPRPAVVAYVNPVHAELVETELGRVLPQRVRNSEFTILATADVPLVQPGAA